LQIAECLMQMECPERKMILIFNELEEIYKVVSWVIDEVEKEIRKDYKPLKPSRLNLMHVIYSIYLYDLAFLVFKCRYESGRFNKSQIKKELEKFCIKKANEKKHQYIFKIRDALKKVECIEHLKWQLSNNQLTNLSLH